MAAALPAAPQRRPALTIEDRQRVRAALLPVAQRHWPERQAPSVANYATTDLLLTGRTLLLPMDEVEAAHVEGRAWVETGR